MYQLTKTSEEILHLVWSIGGSPETFMDTLKSMPPEESKKKLEEFFQLIDQLNGAVGAMCAEDLT
jgi:hypothetical protein